MYVQFWRKHLLKIPHIDRNALIDVDCHLIRTLPSLYPREEYHQSTVLPATEIVELSAWTFLARIFEENRQSMFTGESNTKEAFYTLALREECLGRNVWLNATVETQVLFKYIIQRTRYYKVEKGIQKSGHMFKIVISNRWKTMENGHV